MQATMNATQSIYISDSATLKRYCDQWLHASVLALDTEFIRTDTFYPIGALVQVSDGSDCFLIDPLSIDDFEPFVSLLADTNIVKVLHSCSEDIEVFDRLFGQVPVPLFDTQIAAAFDGYGFSLGYQGLTEAMLGIHVPKGETRSNWLQRPLSESQVHYAALDVAYLPRMYHMLKESLERKGRWLWVLDECEALSLPANDERLIKNYFNRVKSAWKLSRRELAILKCLIEWREAEARRKDRPRGRIVKDKSCFEIAKLQPVSLAELAMVDEVGRGTLNKYGDTILELISSAMALQESELPEKLTKPLPPQAGSVLKKLKVIVREKADKLQLAPEVLMRKKDYEALLHSGYFDGQYQLPATLLGWRKDIIGSELLNSLMK